METPAAAALPVPPFRQPKPWIRWAAVLLAVLGWWLSLQLLQATAASSVGSPLLNAVCGGGQADAGWDCRSVLRSRWGQIRLGPDDGSLKIPVSALGMAYFAFVGLWYLLVGPPTRGRGVYHLVILAVVLCGVWSSLDFIRIMAFQLHRWCAGCLAVHAINGGLLVLTIAAWPWKKPVQPVQPKRVYCATCGQSSGKDSVQPVQPHPTGRLVLAVATAGLLAVVCHLTVVVLSIAGVNTQKLTDAYRKIADDPEYVVWNHQRQPVVSLPLEEDEVFLGSPQAPNTVVVFSDFQCPMCRKAHEALEKLVESDPERLRVAYRHFPEDSACNPHPNFKAGGHAAACRAARACEAARVVGGPDALAKMRRLLYERQDELELNRYEDWAAQLGLDRAAFAEAMNSPAVAERIKADVDLGIGLGIASVPTMYLNGRRLDGWSKPRTWDTLLAEDAPPAQESSPAPIIPASRPGGGAATPQPG